MTQRQRPPRQPLRDRLAPTAPRRRRSGSPGRCPSRRGRSTIRRSAPCRRSCGTASAGGVDQRRDDAQVQVRHDESRDHQEHGDGDRHRLPATDPQLQHPARVGGGSSPWTPRLHRDRACLRTTRRGSACIRAPSRLTERAAPSDGSRGRFLVLQGTVATHYDGLPVLGAQPGQFLLKDLVLIGVAVWTLGDALGARTKQVTTSPTADLMRA